MIISLFPQDRCCLLIANMNLIEHEFFWGLYHFMSYVRGALYVYPGMSLSLKLNWSRSRYSIPCLFVKPTKIKLLKAQEPCLLCLKSPQLQLHQAIVGCVWRMMRTNLNNAVAHAAAILPQRNSGFLGKKYVQFLC